MDINEKCLFFAGGKGFRADCTNERTKLLIVKNDDGSVSITLNLTIEPKEAKDAILKYSELTPTGESTVEVKANTVFIETYDDHKLPKPIQAIEGGVSIAFDKDDISEIILKAYVIDSGKTDHAKTDHPAMGK